MSVKSRRDVWIVDVTWPDGIRWRKKMPDEDTATRIDNMIAIAKVDGSWPELRITLEHKGAKAGLFRDFSDFYIKQYVRLQNKAIKTKLSRISHLKKRFGGMPLEAIRPQHLTAYISWRKGQGVSNATVNRELSVLRHMLEWAEEEELIKRNPIRKLKKLREVISDRRPREEDIDAVFLELDVRVIPLYTFVRWTGCRREEALSLKRWQVNIAKEEVIFTDNTKSDRFRYVPLPQEAIEAIEAMPPHPNTEYVFYNPNTGERWYDCRKPWLAARKAAGVPSLTVKDLRKAYGIKLAESGCPMHYIQAVLGHASVRTTERYYAVFSPQSAKKQVLRVLQGGKAQRESA